MSEESKGTLTEDQKKIVREIVKQSKELGINPEFAVALANLESSFRHVPAEDKKSTAFGPFQVNKATAEANGVDYEKMKDDPTLAIRTGLLNISRHANNPALEGDPMRIAAAHRMGENSEYAKTGDPKTIDPVLKDYLVNVTQHFPEQTLPETIYTKPEDTGETTTQADTENGGTWDDGTGTAGTTEKTSQSLPLPTQSLLTGTAGSLLAGTVGTTKYPLAWAWNKLTGSPSAPDIPAPPATASEWPGTQTPVKTTPVAPTTGDYTTAEKQRLSVGDKTNMTGRESQVGYTEATAQQAARRKVQERTAQKLGLDIDRPLAEYPNIASTKSGQLITQEELNRQNALAAQAAKKAADQRFIQQQLNLRAAQRVGSDWQKLVDQGLAMSASNDPTLRQRGKDLLNKLSSTGTKVGSSFPAVAAKFGFGAGAAIPYSVELAREGHPYYAGALPVAAGVAASKFPKTFGGLTTGAGLYGAYQAMKHPEEFSSGLSMSDISPTAFMGMPEEITSAFPEFLRPKPAPLSRPAVP